MITSFCLFPTFDISYHVFPHLAPVIALITFIKMTELRLVWLRLIGLTC